MPDETTQPDLPNAADDAALVARARTGERAALDAIVRRFAPDAVRVAVAIVGSLADAEDVAQVGFVKAFNALDRFRDGALLRPWLMRIVANEAKNSRRSTQRRARATDRAAARYCVIAPSAEEGAAQSLAAGEVLAALARLDERDRLVIALRYFADLSEAEMAVALDCAPGTVKSRLSRSMARLRVVMGGEVAHG